MISEMHQVWAVSSGVVIAIATGAYYVGSKVQKLNTHGEQLVRMEAKIDAAAKERGEQHVLLLQSLNFGRRNARDIAHIYEESSIRPRAISVADEPNGEGNAE